MTRYHVFYGAPPAGDIHKLSGTCRWRTVSSYDSHSVPLTLPPATLAAASRRISMMYENVIFGRSQEDEGSFHDSASFGEEEPRPEGQTTLITWAPTTQTTDERSRSKAEMTFLRPSITALSCFHSQRETQATQETDSYLNESNASSVAQFPTFHFSLHAITSLDTLIKQAQAARVTRMRRASHKVCLLAAVLEVEGPDTIRVKRGPDAGLEVSLLKLILGDESGGVCKLAVWRQTAEDWGGLDPEVTAPSVKKGDIVLLENVLASWEAEHGDTTATIPVNLSASPQLRSRMQICYRTMPCVPQDARLRPDLRLGFSDAAVRKVASVVKWFEDVAGLS
ncbi:hypothetical protein BD414DRAFT_482823 [Trametes punicea]|nr:hypothetical protein BD414DRAFT_482823 [Trametes punicea]